MRALNTALAALALLIPASALAQSWPDRSIRLVVPFPAGGPTDIIARVVGQAMTDALGQPVVIDNRGGAGGVTGTDQVARAAPDGYTLALSSAGALSISPSLQRMPYNSTRDLAPITLVAKVPELLVVPAASTSRTLEDFIAAAKAKPGGFNYASTGPGGMPHLAAELLKATARIDMVHVPYSGAQPAYQDLLGGRIDLFCDNSSTALPQVKGEKVKAFAVSTAKRYGPTPDLPSVKETGVADMDMDSWFGLFAPRATPQPVLDRLRAEMTKVRADPGLIDIFSKSGGAISTLTPAEAEVFARAEAEHWGRLIREAGVTAE